MIEILFPATEKEIKDLVEELMPPQSLIDDYGQRIMSGWYPKNWQDRIPIYSFPVRIVQQVGTEWRYIGVAVLGDYDWISRLYLADGRILRNLHYYNLWGDRKLMLGQISPMPYDIPRQDVSRIFKILDS